MPFGEALQLNHRVVVVLAGESGYGVYLAASCGDAMTHGTVTLIQTFPSGRSFVLGVLRIRVRGLAVQEVSEIAYSLGIFDILCARGLMHRRPASLSSSELHNLGDEIEL